MAGQAAVAVHIRSHQRHRGGHITLQATDVVEKRFGSRAVFVAEDVFAGVLVDDALVDVHGAAGLTRNRLGHEGGVHVVAQRGLAHRALEEKHLIGQPQRVGVEKVDFHLARADFVDQRVHVQLHLVAVVVDFFKQRVELVHRVDAVGLARGFGPATAPDGGFERHVGVGVAGGEVELQLWGHHRAQALGFVQIAHPAQHAAGGKRHQVAVVVKAVVNHLRRGVGGPGHDAHGAGVGPQLHVFVGRIHHIVVGAALRKLARHAHAHNALRQAHAPVFGELATGQDFSACHAGQVGHQAFHLGHAAVVEPAFQVVEGHVFVQLGHVCVQ